MVHALVLFCNGLTCRMGFAQQRGVHQLIDFLLWSLATASYLIGWYFQRFSVCLYIILAGGALMFLVLVPNWQMAWRCAAAGRMLNPDGDVEWLPNELVRGYYEKLRADELKVDPTRKGPIRDWLVAPDAKTTRQTQPGEEQPANAEDEYLGEEAADEHEDEEAEAAAGAAEVDEVDE